MVRCSLRRRRCVTQPRVAASFGGYPGAIVPQFFNPEGVASRRSVRHVPLVIRHAVGSEQLAELRLKVEPTVMLHLPFDVPFHRLTQRLTHREGSISGLPLKTAQRCSVRLSPGRRGPLQLLDPFGHRDGATLARQNMDMIVNATDLDHGAIKAHGDRGRGSDALRSGGSGHQERGAVLWLRR